VTGFDIVLIAASKCFKSVYAALHCVIASGISFATSASSLIAFKVESEFFSCKSFTAFF